MSHIYNDTFFDYINQSARASAKPLIALLFPKLQPQSVIDLGSGRGVWLDEWQRAGARDVLAVDGDYVSRDQLAVAAKDFLAADLTAPVETGRRFDLAQSLEVGEHLPTEASETLVDSLTRASDRVLFSAAVTGQGGEFHVNEQPLSFWQDLFASRGYTAFDCVRPELKDNKEMAPWYRYNAILYVNEAGRKDLPPEILATEIKAGKPVKNVGNLAWRLRLAVVSKLPRRAVTFIAQARALVLAIRARRAKTVGRVQA
ncbi:class I SAM-dependent methyltransferase [Sulfitobacter sp.]|uniref:class I SAM-dependent methyltransferase n=1 Tax=Sulfitobacter sp. TaxID=1903071 RepID=UPI0035636446